MQPIKLEVGQEFLPSSLLEAQLFLSLEEGISRTVCDYSKYTPK